MKKRIFSALLALVMVLAMAPAMATTASAAHVTNAYTISTDSEILRASGLRLEAGAVYRITGSKKYCSVSNTGDGAGLVIEGTAAAPTVLYIPEGYSLTVTGGKTHPGIELTEGHVLIVTGGGTLSVTGGNAEGGEDGGHGGSSSKGTHGFGAAGGDGGRGAGAGIGLRGQAGGHGGSQTGTSGGGGETGNSGSSADYVVETMGDLIVMGNTKISAYSGNPAYGGVGGVGGTGHAYSGNKDQSGGGGGGGGGGGSGGYGIGGGGIGGGGGGGGGSGVGGKKSNGANGDGGGLGWTFNNGTTTSTAWGAGGRGGNGGGGKGDSDTVGGGNSGAGGGQGLTSVTLSARTNFFAANILPKGHVIEISTTDDYVQKIVTNAVQPLYTGNDRIVTSVANNSIDEWVPNDAVKYTITLNANVTDGSVYDVVSRSYFTSGSKTVWMGHTTIPNATYCDTWQLSRTGYKLKGFFDKASGGTMYYDASGKSVFNTPAWGTDYRYFKAGDLTLYAQWEPVTAEVTFDPNGGLGDTFKETWTYGQTPANLGAAKLPKNTGYIFSGYYDAASGGSQIMKANGSPNISKSTYTSSKTLYARWTPITYRIQFYGDNGTSLLGEMKNVAYNNLTLPGANGKSGSTQVFSSISKSGHVFIGWSTVPGLSTAMYEANKHYTVGLTDTQDATVRLYPAWRAMDNYTVTYDANGGTGAPEAESVREDNSGYTLSSAKPTRDNYTFQGWATTPNAATAGFKPGASFGTVTADVTLYAVWKQNPSVTYDANGGYFTVSLPVDYPSPDGKYTLTTVKPVREGYDFAGWLGNGPFNGNINVVYKTGFELKGHYDDITLTAQWTRKKYTLTLEPGDVTLDFKAPANVESGKEYSYKTDFTFTATGDGTVRVYVNGVLLSPQDDGNYHFTMTDATTVKAELTKRVEYYIVSYDPNGGVNAPFDRGEYAAGDSVTVGAAPTREGYAFDGWRDGAKTYRPGDGYTMDAHDVTFTAQWTANSYSIVYNANGGTGDMADSAMKYDVGGEISQNGFTKTGYRFTGWALSPDGLPYYLGGETVRNLTAENDGVINLYARWTAEEYAVTLDAMGGTPAKSYGKATYSADMPAIPLPTRTGYIFGGYYDAPADGTCYYDDTGASMSRWNKDTDATLYARWTPIRYSVDYDLGGAEGSIPSTPFTYDESRELPKVDGYFTLDGYRFTGWALSKNGSVVYEDGATVKNLASEDGAVVKLYAVWEPIPTYTLHYDANGGTAAPADDSALEGDDCTVSDQKPVYNGYRFLGWSENPAAQAPRYSAGDLLTMTRNITIYAVWRQLKTYTITYDPGVNDGSVSNLPASGTKTEDETYVLSSMIPVREGYDFRGWSINGINKDYEANDAYDGNAPLTLYALWEAKTYGLTLSENGVGTITVRRGSDELVSGDAIRYGDVLDITATPPSGYSTAAFWCLVNGSIVTTGDASRITTQLTVTGDVAVTLLDARSTEVRYTVKYDANGGTGTIADQTVNSSDATQLRDGTGFTKDHAKLIGWATAANGGVAYALGETLTAPIAADSQTVTLYAVWQTDETYTVSYDPNGGIGAPVDETAYFENDTVTVSNDEPTRKGYDFKGWSDGNSTHQPGDTFAMPAGNVKLTAQWERETYTVTVDNGGVATVMIENEQSEYPGDTVISFTVSATPPNVLSRLTVAVNGSVMQLTEANGVLTGSFVLTQNSTITVRSGATTYTVSYDANGGTPAQAETATCITGESVTLHSGAGYARDGYHIAGWNTAPDGSGTAYALGALVAGFDADTTLYAVWADDRGYSYTIVYKANGGDGADQRQEMYENVLSTPLLDGTGFTKDHARIAGWNTAADGSGTGYALGAVLTAPIAADSQTVTLYAVWQTDETYTVSYDPNGGIGAPVDGTAYFDGDTVTVIFADTPTRSGWTFLGWDTDRSARTPAYTIEGDSFTMRSANVTLYAIWQQNASTYTVRYDANGGTGIPTDGNAYLSGDTVTVKFTPQPTRPDWTFLGWARSSTAATPEFTTARGTFTMGSGDVTLYAVWQKIQSFTVAYDANAGGELVTALPGAGSKTAGVDYTVSPTVPARSGYTFLGWSRSADGTVEFAPGAAYTEDADLTLYAVWERIAYTVSIDDGGVADVALTTNPNQNRFPCGTTVDFTVTALDPNVLGSLTVAVNGAVMQMTEANGVLTGSFVLERDSVIAVRSGATTYTVAYDANGGEPAAGESQTYVTGMTLVLHDGAGFTKSGYHISGWNTASDGSGDAYALAQVLTSDLTAVPRLYAVWDADPDARGYSYTVNYDPNGGTGTVKTQTLYQNELTTPLYGSADVSDFAKGGYTLIGWTTVPGGTVVSYALGSTLPAPLASAGQTVTLYAVWQLDEITVTLSDPQQVCTVPSISVRLGSSYGVLPVLTKDGWTFHGWFNERGEKIESTTLVTNGAPHTLYARWTSNYNPPAPREDDDGYSRAYRKCPRDKTCPAYIFTDLDLRLWYHDGIHFCVENGLMQGLPGSLFAPGGTATRAQLVTILWRIAGEPEAADAGFADVSPDDWFAAAVNWAEETGIVLGYGDGSFGPADPVTREQLAAVLYRCARERGDDVAKASDVSILSFEDSAEASEWAVPALQWACSTGVIAGTTESALSPKATATRAQIAAMIMRFLVEIEH